MLVTVKFSFILRGLKLGTVPTCAFVLASGARRKTGATATEWPPEIAGVEGIWDSTCDVTALVSC